MTEYTINGKKVGARSLRGVAAQFDILADKMEAGELHYLDGGISLSVDTQFVDVIHTGSIMHRDFKGNKVTITSDLSLKTEHYDPSK